MNFVTDILNGILCSLIVIFLWIAIYGSAGRGVIQGYSIEEDGDLYFGWGVDNSLSLMIILLVSRFLIYFRRTSTFSLIKDRIRSANRKDLCASS